MGERSLLEKLYFTSWSKKRSAEGWSESGLGGKGSDTVFQKIRHFAEKKVHRLL